MVSNFIKTQDENIYKYLLSQGFQFVGKDGNFYCFINDINKLNFEDSVYKKIFFTNMIAI